MNSRYLNYVIYDVIIILLGAATGLEALKCHKCISVSCPDQPAFCNAVKDFVLKQLPEFYYYMDNGLPSCPQPTGAEDAWDILKSTSSDVSCGEEKDGEATCTLGRFMVTTLLTDLQKNITTYGTVLGCAKRKLLEYTREAVKLKNQCSIVLSVSPVRNSLKHYMEFEHCPMISDMCHDEDYCIKPELSVVKSFKEVNYGISVPMGILIGVVLLIGLIVAVLTFAGIKYNS